MESLSCCLFSPSIYAGRYSFLDFHLLAVRHQQGATWQGNLTSSVLSVGLKIPLLFSYAKESLLDLLPVPWYMS